MTPADRAALRERYAGGQFRLAADGHKYEEPRDPDVLALIDDHEALREAVEHLIAAADADTLGDMRIHMFGTTLRRALEGKTP